MAVVACIMLKFGSKSDVTVVHRATVRLLDDSEIIHCDFQVGGRAPNPACTGRREFNVVYSGEILRGWLSFRDSLVITGIFERLELTGEPFAYAKIRPHGKDQKQIKMVGRMKIPAIRVLNPKTLHMEEKTNPFRACIPAAVARPRAGMKRTSLATQPAPIKTIGPPLFNGKSTMARSSPQAACTRFRAYIRTQRARAFPFRNVLCLHRYRRRGGGGVVVSHARHVYTSSHGFYSCQARGVRESSACSRCNQGVHARACACVCTRPLCAKRKHRFSSFSPCPARHPRARTDSVSANLGGGWLCFFFLNSLTEGI